MKEISVVLPVYNETGNLRKLYRETKAVLAENFVNWEFVFVDDGSIDGSNEILRELRQRNSDIKVIQFKDNFGQSAALDAGLKQATGDVIVTMDSDGQNDPGDIPRLVNRLDGGIDCVCGWRRDRQDSLGKTLSSEAARHLRRIVLNTNLHDFGCTLKAFTAEAASELEIKGEMHRYIPPLLNWRGYDVDEIAVNHRPREDGATKYGWRRIPKGFVDLINVWFWQKYSSRPLHIFGGLGVTAVFAGFLFGLYSAYLKVFAGVSLSDTVLPLLAVFVCLLGIQFFICGILADINAKSYFAVQGKEEYRIDEVLAPTEPRDSGTPKGSQKNPIFED